METREKCPVCGSQNAFVEQATHHFIESGLENVYLANVDFLVCPDCGERIVSIPSATRLLSCIAEGVVLSPNPLTGPEIRFLRKNLHMKINDFAVLLGVDRATISYWENGHNKPSKIADRLIRRTFAAEAKLSSDTMEKLNARPALLGLTATLGS